MFFRGLRRAGDAAKRSNIAQNAINNTKRQMNNNVPDVGQKTKGWTFLSPNIAHYRALEGSMVSIGLRAALVWNVAMFVYEFSFYPYDMYDLVLFKKIE